MAAAHDIITNFTVHMPGATTTTKNTYTTLNEYLNARDKGYVTTMGFEAHLAKAWPYVDNLNLNESKYSRNYNTQSSVNVPNYSQSTSYQADYLSQLQNSTSRTAEQQSNSIKGKTTASRDDLNFVANSDKAKVAIKNALKELASGGMSQESISRAASHLSSLSDADRAEAVNGFYQLMNIASAENAGSETPGALQFYVNGLMGFDEQAASTGSEGAKKALEELDFAIEALKQSGNTANSLEVLMPMLLQLSNAITPTNADVNLENMPQATSGHVNFGLSGSYQSFTVDQLTTALSQIEHLATQTANLGTAYQSNGGQVPVANGEGAADLGQVPNIAPQTYTGNVPANDTALANGIIPVDLASTLPGYVQPNNANAPINTANANAGANTAIINAQGEMVGQAQPQTQPQATPVNDMVGTGNTPVQQQTSGESVTVTSYSSAGNTGTVADTMNAGSAMAANGVVAASAMNSRITDNTSELAALGITGTNGQGTVVTADGIGMGKAMLENGAKTVDEQVLAKLMESAKNTAVGKTSQVEMTLNPERLGKIFLKLVNENGALTVTVAAQNASTEKLLQQKAGQLLSGLQENGVVVKDIQVVSGGQQTAEAGMDFYAGQNGSYSREQNSGHTSAQNSTRTGLYGTENLDAADETKEASGGHTLWQTI